MGVNASTTLHGHQSSGDLSLDPNSLFNLGQVISNPCLGRDCSADLGAEFQAAGPTQQPERSAGEQGTQHLWKLHCQFNVIFFQKKSWLGLLVTVVFPCIC